MKGKLLLFIAASFILVQCSTVKYTSFHGETQEAKITLPDSLQNLAILNRTRPNGALTGGLSNRPGVDQVLSSFKSEVNRRKYFKVSAINKVLKADQTGNFPMALTQEELQNAYTNGDYIVASLEVFQVQELNEYMNERKMQLDTQGNEYYIDIVKGVKTLKSKTGWRMYNTIDGSIIDEFMIDHDHSYEVVGVDRANATAKMEARVEQSYKDLGSVIGFMYAERVSPSSSYVSRKYYSRSKSCPELKQAVGFIKMKDWETAKHIWEDGLLSNVHPKDIAKLHYNLGVFYERRGDIDMAITELEKCIQSDSQIGRAYLTQLKSVKKNGYLLPTN